MKNLKGKIFTKCIVTVMIAIILMAVIAQHVVNAQRITLSSLRQMCYSVNSNQLYHFREQTNTYNNLYCLNGGAHRGAYDVLVAGGSINNMNDATINQIFTTRERYNSAMWLLDNMYIANDADAATKAMMLENIANVVKAKEEVVEKTYNVELDHNW